MARQANINPKEVKPMVEGLMANLSNTDAVLKSANVSSITIKAIITTINDK
jgi:serine/threonine-protein kinase HipA